MSTRLLHLASSSLAGSVTYAHLKNGTIVRDGQRLDPSAVSDDDIDHRFCGASVFARTLQNNGNVFLTSSDSRLRALKRLLRSNDRSETSTNWSHYTMEHPWILDTFCLLDYQVMPIQPDPLAHFKLVTAQGTERLPRPPLSILVHSLRSDLSALSELLRRDLCTELCPDKIHEHPAEFFRQRLRVICAIQNLSAEHSLVLAPHDHAFLYRSCAVCVLYDPEIIRFSRDLHCILLRIFHADRIKPPSCRLFTPLHELLV